MADEGQITYTYREYLALKTVQHNDVSLFEALEAVATTAIEHPEWDMDGEEKPWSEWEAMP